MCKLLGISFRDDGARHMTQYYLRDFFAQFGPIQPHGWGLSFYDTANRPVLFKEPVPAHTSASLRFLLEQRPIQSNYVIAHVRYRSVGPIVYDLTQPFTNDMYSFVHNGTLYRMISKLDPNDSDSYSMFRGFQDTRRTPVQLMRYFLSMNDFGSMSTIVSDGKYLMAYRDRNGSTPLHYRKIKGGYLVCSQPLSNAKKWKVIEKGCGIVFVEGELVDILNPSICSDASLISY